MFFIFSYVLSLGYSADSIFPAHIEAYNIINFQP